MPPFLEMKNITKRFPGVLANDNINFHINEGEIHALLGENGAGKSTLMQILYGLYQKDHGEILVQGNQVNISDPSGAIANGIGMIHQDFMLVPPFTVIENVVLGLADDNPGPLLDLNSAADRLKDLSKQYGLAVDPHARIEHLPVGVQQRVEILKLLYRNVKVLILDEPTAVLTPQEVEGLFEVLQTLKEKGHAVVLITHKLHEVMAVADRVTILRGGQVIATLNKADTDSRELARLMVGREIVFRVDKQPSHAGETLLKVEDLHAYDDANHHKLRGINLEICRGEILGLAGVDGNGQSELAEALMNLRNVNSGCVLVGNKDVTHLSPAAHRALNMTYIPADRRRVGSVGDLSVAYNSILGDLIRFTGLGHFLINEKLVASHAKDLVKRFDVRTPDIRFHARKLSGGNLQKLILGREVMRQPQVLIAEQPTRGLDVGATEYVQQQLLAERERRAAILLISAELEEILTLSDRIAVIYQGEIMGVLDAEDADLETLGLMMAGSRLENLTTRGVVNG